MPFILLHASFVDAVYASCLTVLEVMSWTAKLLYTLLEPGDFEDITSFT